MTAPVLSAQPDGGGHFEIEVDTTLFNPCTHENVMLHGTLRGRVQVTGNPQQGFHVRGMVHAHHVTGTGETSGAQYRGSGQARFHGMITTLPGSVEVMARFHLNRQGHGGNARGTARLLVTVDAMGHPTVTVLNVDLDCRRGLTPEASH
ncbi:MAG TPA: hypothetical protein VD962_10860 [Rubricoccaceae bacterium]|nr:hypothetical protein [Rubricoccaceae bacterium]